MPTIPKENGRFHLMSVNGSFKDITRADLLAEADRFGVRRANDLLADVRSGGGELAKPR